MDQILIIILGALIVTYVTGQWLVYFLHIHSWLGLFRGITISFLVLAGLWFKQRWAGYLVAAAIGVAISLVFSGNLSMLLPVW